MNYIIWAIRSAFCKHDWRYSEVRVTESYVWGTTHDDIAVSATCKKCGWHRSYYKYNTL